MPIEHFRLVDSFIHSFATKYILHAERPSFCWYCRAYEKIIYLIIIMKGQNYFIYLYSKHE